MIQLNAYHELSFWKENLKMINGRAFIAIEVIDKVMFSSAFGSKVLLKTWLVVS